ncbi:MAG TPA: hypothetical protein VFL72_07930 [Acidimicrobiia bacterium]|nr:hypothetical protein [Acidimicrobiia bacterium]
MSRLDLADGLRMLDATRGDYLDHQAHLRFAWAVLDEADDIDDAVRVVSLTVRHVSELGGNPGKYHETVTVFWIRLMAHLRERYPDLENVEQMVERYPAALDPGLPNRHWSDLDSPQARTSWVEPDLIPLP